MKSDKTARLAVEQGYTNVHLYREGISAWGKAGYEYTVIEAIPRLRVALLSPEEMKTVMDGDQDTIILDIRDNDLYEAMGFPYDNVLHIQMTYLEDEISRIPRDKKIIIVCHAGKQGMQAGPFLKSRGFDIIGCLNGGIMAWQRAGQDVRNGSGR